MKTSFASSLRTVLRGGACLALALFLAWEIVELDGGGSYAPAESARRLVLSSMVTAPLVAPALTRIHTLLAER